ncbi:hypothetical protein EX895_006407 [Sporisorium graminicola]|uniref:Uncharacterized protein n=1 Tax=Sporisorium graminicola TaxID=280036 RepID=A0A4U7KL57_9BASI|nr:hypothetical protein EX895_006407 [Sporisorium graminicola]TKY84506.1 hypothetical protein EX895_006407 [Sporisorium graminicola]
MTSRPSATAPSTSSSTGSPSLSAPPIRLRHPLPVPPLQRGAPQQQQQQQQQPPSRSRSLKSSHPSSSTASSSSAYSTLRTSPRYSYPITTSIHHPHSNNNPAPSPSTSPYYSSSHPSPAPSSASSAGGSSSSGSAASSSSLRTPPDLLINGSSVGHQGSKAVHQLAVNTWNGLAVKTREVRNLREQEIRRRQELLKGLASLRGEGLQLPSPPPSPGREAAAVERGGKRRRASVEGADEAAPHSRAPPPPPLPPPRSLTTAMTAVSTTRHPSLPPSSTLPSLASAYRTAARDLKHAADARASSLSTSRPSYLASRPTQVSALEQLDAVLLFSYAFWLDDLSSAGDNIVTKNWISLFGLLRYATNAHSDLGNDVCLGVCRLVEAAVLRKLHAHDTAVLLRMLDRSEPTPETVATMVRRQAADLERSDRLAAQARGLLSVSSLAATHPALLEKALASSLSCTEAGAKSVDPSSAESCGKFAWPLDSTSSIPHLVAFGRCAVAEQARRSDVGFVLKYVVADE